METSLEENDREGWAEADDRFHRLLIENCGNKRLALMASTLRDQGHRARLITLKLRDKPLKSNKDHRDVLQAILAGNVDEAMRIHHDHRRHAADVLVKILEDYKLPHL